MAEAMYMYMWMHPVSQIFRCNYVVAVETWIDDSELFISNQDAAQIDTGKAADLTVATVG